jgi:hypothetical protein
VAGFNLAAAQVSFPLGEYTELTDNAKVDVSGWASLSNRLYASWASKDVHYVKQEVPSIKMKTDTVVYAWRGERVGVEAVLFSPVTTEKLRVRLTSWTKGSQTVSASQGEVRFVNYVLSDEFKSCGTNPRTSTTHLIPDCIDVDSAKVIDAKTTRPVWCTLEVPYDLEAGEYNTALEIVSAVTGKVLETLTLRVNVRDKTLPQPADQTFFLNLWMQPYAVSRYYQVDKWSQAHFDAMRPYMLRMARAGQRVATAILFYEPWGDQSYDKFDPMIQTTKKTDGSWSYDYSIFDHWINFLDTCGINKQINCFSMVPWDMSFRYYDEASSTYKTLKTTTGSADYKSLWTSFLTAFASHLKDKGWYDKTCIAMDERALSNMQDAYNVVQSSVPGMKMALAGNYHSELATKIYDYCVALGQSFSTVEMKTRRSGSWPTTFYVSCADAVPNIFTNSDPAEAAYLPFYGLANNFDGFLHWSFMNWGGDPLRDSRFRLFSPGDTYCVYPGNRSSVRFERLIEGIEATEKVRILRKQYVADKNQTGLLALSSALAQFAKAAISDYYPASYTVNYMESLLNESPLPTTDKLTDYCPITIPETNRDIALQKRWLASATTTGCETDLHYTSSAQSTNGWVTAPTTIQIRQGETFRLQVVPTTNDDDIRYCRAGLFADWNNDSIFNVTDNEVVARVGSANQTNSQLLNCTFSVSVPETAKTGLTRLRLCYADAWSGEPMPCGDLVKGFAFDIPMQILPKTTGVSASRNEAPYVWRSGVLTLAAPSRLAVYTIGGACVDAAYGVTTYNTNAFTKGEYVICIHFPNGRYFSTKFSRAK